MSTVPFLVDAGGFLVQPLTSVEAAPAGKDSRAWLRELLHRQPSLLPIEELRTAFAPLVSLGCGIDTGSGELDNLFVSPLGRITLVMIDAPRRDGWNRPVEALVEHGRRVAHWDCDQFLEQAAQSRGAAASAEFAARMALAQQQSGVSPAHFEGALAANLTEGDFLLLVVGERISRETYLRIQELRSTGGLGMRLAIVELPFFRCSVERETWLLALPRVVMRADRREPPHPLPIEFVPLTTFPEPKSCREFHDRLQAEGVEWRTQVKRSAAAVFVNRLHEQRARRLLQEHLATHSDLPKTGFQITHDYAIFGGLIAGAFGMILLAVEYRSLSDLVRPLMLVLLGGVVGWVLEKGRVSHRATGSFQFSAADFLVACGAALLAGILFLGALTR